MPEYSFSCKNCSKKYSVFLSFVAYDESIKNNSNKCIFCNSKKVARDYETDCRTMTGSVKKSDNELKTLGDLANRNRDRMSEDQKISLYKKHNSYKDTDFQKPLPNGMKRLDRKAYKKTKWIKR